VVTCPTPTAPFRGQVSPADLSQYVHSDIIAYSCLKGFKQVGARDATCNENGEWSNAPPNCNSKFGLDCEMCKYLQHFYLTRTIA